MFKINMRLPLFLGKFQFHNAITQRLTLLISVLVHGRATGEADDSIYHHLRGAQIDRVREMKVKANMIAGV